MAAAAPVVTALPIGLGLQSMERRAQITIRALAASVAISRVWPVVRFNGAGQLPTHGIAIHFGATTFTTRRDNRRNRLLNFCSLGVNRNAA